MTDDNHKLSDDELDDFLAGRHAVSQAHRELDGASPPEALDAKILARARESVKDKPDFSKDVFIRSYATAATVFLCLAITFMLVREPDVPTPADLRSPAEILERSIPLTAPQESPGAPAREESGDADAESAPRNGIQAEDRADTGAGAATVAEPARTEGLQNLLDLVEGRRLDETAPPPQRREPDTVTALAAGQAPAVNASDTRQQAADTADAATTASQEEDALEEVVVTGSRLRAAPGYRDDRETWLREIARLREAGEPEAAAEEAGLFLERYPGADLDAELAALESP